MPADVAYNRTRDRYAPPPPDSPTMNDALVVAVVLAFFAMCAAYVTWCDRVLSADAEPTTAPPTAGAASSPGAVDVRHR